MAQRLANDFIQTHIDARVRTSQKSLEFIEGELERSANSIREVEAVSGIETFGMSGETDDVRGGWGLEGAAERV